MIVLPPGCKVGHDIAIDINQLTDDIIEWFRMIGGKVTSEEFISYTGSKRVDYWVQYGRGKRCYKYQNNTGRVKLHFSAEDATVASMFILKFNDNVVFHNLKGHTEYV